MQLIKIYSVVVLTSLLEINDNSCLAPDIDFRKKKKCFEIYMFDAIIKRCTNILHQNDSGRLSRLMLRFSCKYAAVYFVIQIFSQSHKYRTCRLCLVHSVYIFLIHICAFSFYTPCCFTGLWCYQSRICWWPNSKISLSQLVSIWKEL